MVAAWGETSEEEDSSQDEAIALVLMAKSESEADSESDESMSQFKEKVRGFNKAKILKLLFSLMDEWATISTENCMFKDTCSKLKRDVRMLEKTIQELEQANEILTSEQGKKPFALSRDIDMLKEQMNTRKEVF